MAMVRYAVGDEPVPGSGYRLVAFLGRGGFGEVWKATAPGGAEAALKIIRFGGREGRKEFRALQLVKRIHHTHLVPIIAFWLKNERGEILDDEVVREADSRESTSPALVSDTLLAPLETPLSSDGPAELIIAMGLGDQSLFDRFEKCREEGLSGIPDEELFAYLKDSARALDFLNGAVHDLGSGLVAIQHCDIKPHNLMIVGGAVQVCDFGLARMMGGDRATTAAASIAYAAPECLVEGKPSQSTDQYSLAVTFFELKTGKLPYDDLSLAAVMDAKRNETLDFSSLPEAAQAVLRRATAANPAERYPSCGEMVDQLYAAMTGSPAGDTFRKTRPRWGRMLAATVVAGAAAIGGWLAWRNLGPGGSPAASGPANPPAAADPEQERLGEALLAQGTEALQKRDFAAAVTDLQRAGKIRPRDARVFSRLGAACSGQKQWDQAVAALTPAILIDPYDGDYLSRGRAYMELNTADKAIADFKEAVRLNPKNAAAYVALGDAAVAKNDAAGAIAALGEAITISSSDPQANALQVNARYMRASAYLITGQRAEMADDLTQVLEMARLEDRAGIHELVDALATSFAEAHQLVDAVKWAKKAVDLAPDEATKDIYRRRLKTYEAAQSGRSS